LTSTASRPDPQQPVLPVADHSLVQSVLRIAQFALDGFGQIRIVNEDAELNVALLGAPREVRAGNKEEPASFWKGRAG
jgi:hypothetical protein